jgi:hypothetical protein
MCVYVCVYLGPQLGRYMALRVEEHVQTQGFECLCVYVYVCVCMYVCVYVYVCVCMYVCVNVYVV